MPRQSPRRPPTRRSKYGKRIPSRVHGTSRMNGRYASDLPFTNTQIESDTPSLQGTRRSRSPTRLVPPGILQPARLMLIRPFRPYLGRSHRPARRRRKRGGETRRYAVGDDDDGRAADDVGAWHAWETVDRVWAVDGRARECSEFGVCAERVWLEACAGRSSSPLDSVS